MIWRPPPRTSFSSMEAVALPLMAALGAEGRKVAMSPPANREVVQLMVLSTGPGAVSTLLA